MDRALLKGLKQTPENLGALEYTEKCIEIYEETLRAIGLPIIEIKGEFIQNSQLVYTNSSLMEEEYAHLSENH